MTGPQTDLGSGHSLRYIHWSPDRELNPQYEGIPDVEKYMALVRHDLQPDDKYCKDQGYCEAGITFAGEVQRRIDADRPSWTVESWDPLTVSPSLLCHCGDHGFIREGKWVVA